MSQKLQTQLFQAALIIVGMTCLLAPRPSDGVNSRGLARNAIASDSSSCYQGLRNVQLAGGSTLNVRSQPNGAVKGKLQAGQSVYVERYDRSGAWAEVSFSEDVAASVGRDRGWVFHQYLGTAPGCSDSLG